MARMEEVSGTWPAMTSDEWEGGGFCDLSRILYRFAHLHGRRSY